MLSTSTESLQQVIRRLWGVMTRPSAAVTDPQTRQQSRLLASILLAGMVVVFFQIILSLRTSTELAGSGIWLIASTLLLVVMCGAYYFTRNGHFRFAVTIILILGNVGIYVPALMVGGSGSYNSLFYLFAVTLFGCVFLRLRTASIIALLQLILLFALQSSFPDISAKAILTGPLSFNFFFSLFMLSLFYQQRKSATERQEELSASEERYRIVTELISDYAFSLQVEPGGSLRHEWITDASFTRTTGYIHTELDKNDNVNLSLYFPEDEPVLQAELEQTLRNEPTSGQHRIRTKDGQIRWLQISRLPVWDANEERVNRYYGIAQDITERKQAELALEESKERYRLLTETISDFVLLVDVTSGKTLYISPPYERAFGYKLDEINQINGTDRIHPDDLVRVLAARDQVTGGTPIEGFEYRARTKSGNYLWLEAYSNPVKDAQGKVTQVIVSARDITSRKQTEMALKASEERYRIVSELISDYAYFYRFNADGTRTREWITDSVERVTGYSPSEMPQKTKGLADSNYLGDYDAAQADIEQIHQGTPLNREFQIYTKQHELRWLNVFRRPVWDENHQNVIGYYGVAQDITERKQVELALKESEQRYRKISELISDYAFYSRVNLDGTTEREWITDSFLRVTGYDPKEISGTDTHILFHPESLDLLNADSKRILTGESVTNDYRIITKQGAIRWLTLVRQPVWDEDEKRVVGYYGVARDITEHKQVEAQKMKLLLEQEQFSMVSHLVVALSHDFRTALATIETSRYLTERLIGDEVRPKVQSKLESIQRSVNHLAAQLENLHMVSFLTVPSPIPSNLNFLINGIIGDQIYKARQKEITLTFTADDAMPLLRIDAVKIEKAIRHLIANALSHTPNAGQVNVYTRHTTDEAIIEVQDSGAGISVETANHIFEPFFRGDEARTVEMGGVGLGLTIVKMIIEAHGGMVNVTSAGDNGSIFTLRLPLQYEIAVSA